MADVFRTISVPLLAGEKARLICDELGYPDKGMFESPIIDPETEEIIGYMSSGILSENSPMLHDEFVIHAAVLSKNPATAITLQDCIDYVTGRDQGTFDPLPRQNYLIDEVAGGLIAPEWVQPTGAHDAYPIDSMVRYKGMSYRNLMDANVWAPTVTGWRLVWGQMLGYAPWQQPLGAQDAYPLEAKVSHAGKNWINSQYQDNVWEPGVFGWEELA